MTSSQPVHLRDGGFGREIRQAQTSRQVWLVEQGLADHSGTTIQYPRDLVAQLQRRELLRVASGLSGELGIPFTEPQDGSHIEGVVRRRVDLVSGRFALIDNGREFSLVPWRRVLDRQIGKEVSGIVREDRVSWTFGRQREGPMIS